MPWNVQAAVNRSTTPDCAGYKWYMDGLQVGDTPQTAPGTDPTFTYTFPEGDRTPLFEVAAYDDAIPTPNIGPRIGISQNFDAVAPAPLTNLRLVSAVFVP